MAMPQRATNAGIELYRSIGVNPVINGIGSVTFLVSPVAAVARSGSRWAALAELLVAPLAAAGRQHPRSPC